MGIKLINLPTLPLSCTAGDILPISQLDGFGLTRTTYQANLQQIKSFVLDGVSTSTGTSTTTVDVSAIVSTGAVNGNVIIYDSTSSKFKLSSNFRVKTIYNDTLLNVSEAGYIVKVNSTSKVTVSVPSNASQPIPIGTQIVLVQENTGIIEIDVETNAVTLNSNIELAGYKIVSKEKNSVINLLKTDINNWVVYGDIGVFTNDTLDEYLFDIYEIDQGYKIKLIFIKDITTPTWTDSVKDVVISAANRWSNILKNTKFPRYKVPGTMYTVFGGYGEILPNPFEDEYFDGLILTIGQENWSLVPSLSDTLGYAGNLFYRQSIGSKSNRIPVVGYMMLNSGRYSTSLNSITDLGVSELYYTVLHELGHTLGFGTEWHVLDFGVGSNVHRSFIVGAGDTSNTNPFGPTGNIFYTIDRGDGSRTANSQGSLLVGGRKRGDTTYSIAYNPNTSVGNSSKAVYHYNQTFSSNVTAIPVESILGEGSYGSHWYEGIPDYNTYGILTGYDNRTYYSNITGGAYAMIGELMSSNGENSSDMPLSKISLGALEDLGYTVDYTQADTYTPNVLKIKLEPSVGIYIKQYNFGGWFKAAWYTTPSTFLYYTFVSLRRGTTYTFLNENTDGFKIYKSVAGTLTEIGGGTSSSTVTIPMSCNTTDLITIKFNSDANLLVQYRIGG
jgi:hypothetical protein